MCVLGEVMSKEGPRKQIDLFLGDTQRDTKQHLLRDMMGMKEGVVVDSPPADTPPSSWRTSPGASPVWSSISLFPYRISSSPPKEKGARDMKGLNASPENVSCLLS